MARIGGIPGYTDMFRHVPTQLEAINHPTSSPNCSSYRMGPPFSSSREPLGKMFVAEKTTVYGRYWYITHYLVNVTS